MRSEYQGTSGGRSGYLPKCRPIARILAYTILPDRAATVRKCEELPKTEIPTPWGDTQSSGGPSERVVGLLMRPPAVENPRFSAVLISSHLLTVAALIGAPTVWEGLLQNTRSYLRNGVRRWGTLQLDRKSTRL